MVHVPIDNQHALNAVFRARIARSDRNRTEETKPHAAGAQCVMTGRAHSAKAARRATVKGHVHGIKQ
jgi:hypothetical protein